MTQLLCALALWLLIWRVAPFRPYEKLLLLLSYFLFWEYFIVSRPYALMTLLGFGFIALRANRPERRIWPWLLLGLLANITLFGAIWSIGLAAFFLFQERQRWRSMLSGVAIFGSALALSIATMGAARGLRAPTFGTAARFQPVPDAVALRRLRLLKQFPSAIVSDEVFTIYQLRAKPDSGAKRYILR